MRELVIKVESEAQSIDAIRAALDGSGPRGECTHSFLSYEDLHRYLTPNRIAILDVMAGKGPMSMREVARLVGRDHKTVHGELTALLKIGLIDRAGRGVAFPYDSVRLDVTLHAARAA